MTTSTRASSSGPFSYSSGEATTSIPAFIEMDLALPELSTPQERYDHGYKRGYMAGYAEGARQAEAERAADLAAHKAACAAAEARTGSLVVQLASATSEYLARTGPRDSDISETLITAAFELAQAVIGSELRARPELALEAAKRALATLPTGPAVVRVNPADEDFVRQAAGGPLASLPGQVTVVADPAVGTGGCMVTSHARTVDARVEEALARARAVFCTPGGDAGSSVSQDQLGRPR